MTLMNSLIDSSPLVISSLSLSLHTLFLTPCHLFSVCWFFCYEMVSYNGLRPSNAAEAKIWNFYNGPRWDWYPIRQWPRFLAEAVMKQQIGNKERFSLFLYFVGNGMDPAQAKRVILRMKRFDRSAITHLDYLERNADRYLQRYQVWDELEEKYL